MTEKKISEFIDTLTEEQRAAVPACRNEEQLAQVLDEHDVEIPDEILAEVTGGKGFIPALLASIMIVSAGGAIASVPINAAEITPAAVVRQAQDNASVSDEALSILTKAPAVFGITTNTTNSDAARAVLTPDQIKELASYLRADYPGTSIYSFLKKNNILDDSYNTKNSGTAYLLTVSGITSDEKLIETSGLDTYYGFSGYKVYLCTTYVKGINIYDPNCEEKIIELSRYTKTDWIREGKTIETTSSKTEYKEYNFFELHNDASESEWNNMHPGVPYSIYNEWKALYPNRKISEYLNWRKKFPGMDVKKFEGFPELQKATQDYLAWIKAFSNDGVRFDQEQYFL